MLVNKVKPFYDLFSNCDCAGIYQCISNVSIFYQFCWLEVFQRNFFNEKESSTEVVSIGTNPTFKVKFTPQDYNPTMSKRLHFFLVRDIYTSSIIVLYFLHKKRVRNKLSPPSHCAGQVKEVIGQLGLRAKHRMPNQQQGLNDSEINLDMGREISIHGKVDCGL